LSTLHRPRRHCLAVLSLVLASSTLLAFPTSAAPLHSARYDVVAHISSDLQTLEGTVRIALQAAHSFDTLNILAYPAQLNVPLAELGDIESPRVYPGRFDPASMEMAFSHQGHPLALTPLPTPPGWRPGTLLALHLDRPVPPNTPLVLEAAFRTTIPERYGPFGHVDHQVTLDGAWFPLVLETDDDHLEDTTSCRTPDSTFCFHPCHAQPPPAHVTLILEVPRATDVILDGRRRDPGRETAEGNQSAAGSARVVAELRNTRFPALALGDFHHCPLHPRVPVTFHARVAGRRFEARLHHLVEQGVAVWTAAGLPLPTHPVAIVRIPMRRNLVRVGEHTIWLSDRAFLADAVTVRYHEEALVQALYQIWLEELLQTRETAPRDRWFAQGLSWYLVRFYRELRDRVRVDVSGVVDRLSFLPEFDEMLNAPRFAFARELYDDVYPEPNRLKTARDLVGPPIPGRVLFLKLEDAFGPRQVMDAALALFSGAEAPFEVLLARRVAQSAATSRVGDAQQALEAVTSVVERWCGPPSRVDHVLEQVSIERRDQGYATRIRVDRRILEGNPPPDLAAVDVVARDETTRVTWRTDRPGVLEVHTGTRPQRVELDPEHRLEERDAAGVVLRGNNIWPRQRKLMFAVAPGAWDPGTWRFQGSAAVYLTTRYQRRWLWWVSAYTSQQVLYGASVGGSRFFGPYRNAVWRRHQLTVSIHANRRGWGTLLEATDRTAQDLAGLRVSHRYDSRLSYRHPIRGLATYVGLEGGRVWQGERTTPYGMMSLSITRPWSWHPRFALVGRVRFDAAAGLPGPPDSDDDGPLALGGAYGVRGLPVSAMTGTLRWILSLEQRWMVVRNPAIHALGVHLSDVQLVALADTGAVSIDLEGLEQPVLSLGAGVRCFFDVLSVGEARIGLDLSRMVHGATGWQALVRFGQPF